MKTLILAAAAAACLIATPALAGEGLNLYGTAGVSHVDTDVDLSFEAVTLRAGAQIVENLAIEAEGSFGFEQDFLDGDTYELKRDLSVYAVGSLPMTPNARILARVGTGTTTIEADGEDMDMDGLRYGIGAEFLFNDTSGVRIDLTRFNLDDDVDADMFSVSYVHNFR